MRPPLGKLLPTLVLGSVLLLAGPLCAQDSAPEDDDLLDLILREGLKQVESIEDDPDGVLLWLPLIRGRLGDFSITARNVLLRIDDHSWRRFRAEQEQLDRGVLTHAPTPSVARRPLQPAEPGQASPATFFEAWQATWGGIFRTLYGEDLWVLRHSSGEWIRARRMFVNCYTGALRADDLQVRLTTVSRDQRIAIILRAKELEKVASGKLAFREASLTTCDFPDPHYDLRAETIRIQPEEDHYRLSFSSPYMAIGGLSVIPLPGFDTRSDDISLSPLRVIRAGHSSKLDAFVGIEIGSSLNPLQREINEWLGIEGKGRATWQLNSDYSFKRGPGTEGLLEYSVKDVYEGYFTAAYRHDKGHDRGAIRGGPEDEDRWRVRTQNRFHLSQRLRADLEFADRSDDAFVSEFFEREWKEDKPQETLGYLRFLEGPLGLELYGRPSSNRFDTTLELQPDMRFHLVPTEVVEPDLLPGIALRTRVQVGSRRLKEGTLSEPTEFDDRDASRLLGEMQLDFPVSLGPVQLVPFAGVSYLGQSNDRWGGDPSDRTFASWGASAATTLSRPLGELWIHRLSPEVRYEAQREVGGDRSELLPLGEEELSRPEDRITFALRNRFLEYPRSRDPGSAPLPGFDLDLDIDYYPRSATRSDQEGWGPLNTRFAINLEAITGVPGAQLYSKAALDVSGIDREKKRLTDGLIGFKIQPDAGLVSTVFLRSATAPEGVAANPDRLRSLGFSCLVLAMPDFDFELSSQYDLDRNRGLDSSFLIRRRAHDFVLELDLSYDPGENDFSVGVHFTPRLLYRTPRDRLSTRTLAQGLGTF